MSDISKGITARIRSVNGRRAEALEDMNSAIAKAKERYEKKVKTLKAEMRVIRDDCPHEGTYHRHSALEGRWCWTCPTCFMDWDGEPDFVKAKSPGGKVSW